MTADPDALRLVRELLALVLLKYGNLDPDVNKLTERAQEFLLAPAVQPAAGREEIALALFAYDGRYGAQTSWKHQPAEATEKYLGAADAILAALAHPPAQGSESGGEDRRAADAALADLAFNLASDLSSGHFGMPDAIQMIEALATRLAALSQPGPASEGDPAHD